MSHPKIIILNLRFILLLFRGGSSQQS